MSQIDSRCLELIHADIDGELSEADAEQLRRCLAEDERARATHEELRALCKGLDAVELEEPPEELLPAIMAAVGPNRSDKRGRFPWFPLASVLRYAAVFFAGAIITTAMFTLSESAGGLHETDLVGTMTRQDRFRAPGKAADTLVLEHPAAAGRARLYPVEDGALIEFELDSQQPVRLEVGFDPASGAFGGFLQLKNQIPTITASEGRVTITSQGDQHFVIALDRTGTTPEAVRIRIHDAESMIKQDDLKMP